MSCVHFVSTIHNQSSASLYYFETTKTNSIVGMVLLISWRDTYLASGYAWHDVLTSILRLVHEVLYLRSFISFYPNAQFMIELRMILYFITLQTSLRATTKNGSFPPSIIVVAYFYHLLKLIFTALLSSCSAAPQYQPYVRWHHHRLRRGGQPQPPLPTQSVTSVHHIHRMIHSWIITNIGPSTWRRDHLNW